MQQLLTTQEAEKRFIKTSEVNRDDPIFNEGSL
jgi:hypothetical protein